MISYNRETKLLYGDCLELMEDIPNSSVDMILTDPPYGTTACKWDSIIPLEPMWAQLKRIIKPNSAIVMTASQPFTTTLIASNMKMFRYCWVWDKTTHANFQLAKLQPLKITEDVIVFSHGRSANGAKNKAIYYPIMGKHDKPISGGTPSTKLLNNHSMKAVKNRTESYPKNVITFKRPSVNDRLHPTQKPVALMEYLIKTYTNEGEMVLDFTMGSGTTGVACKNLNRDFIGIELDKEYFEIAKKRIEETEDRLL